MADAQVYDAAQAALEKEFFAVFGEMPHASGEDTSGRTAPQDGEEEVAVSTAASSPHSRGRETQVSLEDWQVQCMETAENFV